VGRTGPAEQRGRRRSGRRRSPADGYTLFMESLATNAVIAHLTKARL